MRIDEGESRVAGDGDTLRGGRQRAAVRTLQRCGKTDQRVEIDAVRHDAGGLRQKCLQCGMFPGLHQPQMPGGCRQRGIAGNCPQNRQGTGGAQHGFMTRAADAVEDDGRDVHCRVVIREPGDQWRDRLRHAGRIDDQHHRQVQLSRQIGDRTAPVGRGAVEQAHRAFDQQKVGRCGQPRDHCRVHCPGVQVGAGRTGGGLVKSRVDVIGAGFRTPDRNAAVA